jgi:hypothetical protein
VGLDMAQTDNAVRALVERGWTAIARIQRNPEKISARR